MDAKSLIGMVAGAAGIVMTVVLILIWFCCRRRISNATTPYQTRQVRHEEVEAKQLTQETDGSVRLDLRNNAWQEQEQAFDNRSYLHQQQKRQKQLQLQEYLNTNDLIIQQRQSGQTKDQRLYQKHVKDTKVSLDEDGGGRQSRGRQRQVVGNNRRARSQPNDTEDNRRGQDSVDGRSRSQSGLRSDAVIRGQTIDLHGLYLNNAMSQVIDFIKEREEKYSADNNSRYIFIITGQGLHSKNNKPVIKPNVENYLKEEGYRYYFNNPGMIKVDLKRQVR